VATAVVYRSASLAQYTDEAVRNPTVQAIMQKVTVVPRPELGIGQSAIVTIRLKNGSEYVRRVDITTGHLEKPMSLDQIKNKYRTCAHSVVNDDNIEKSIDKILSLEKLSGIGQLTSLIAGDSSGCIS
jgi:2-methylcitrate dehydratase PrpD